MENQEFPNCAHELYTLDVFATCNNCSLPNTTQNYLVHIVHTRKQKLCTIYLDKIKIELHDGEDQNYIRLKTTITIQILPTGTKGFMLIFTQWYKILDNLWE